MAALNTPQMMKLIGWMYKVPGDSFWQFWNSTEKPHHLTDKSQDGVVLEPVYGYGEDQNDRALVDPVLIVNEIMKDKDDSDGVAVSVGLLKQVIALAATAKSSKSLLAQDQLARSVEIAKLEAEILDLGRDYRKYVNRAEAFETAILKIVHELNLDLVGVEHDRNEIVAAIKRAIETSIEVLERQ